ncbi:GntR family transcriptional regulator [Ancylobacter terrae]|uniref:GntR family transcriptional regulator n=1 Tax=Ancylobacter sp. sgz301288 TaxID=3342077 RepID=UPI00385EC0F4
MNSPQALNRAIPEGLAALLEEEIVYGRLPPAARLTEEEVALRYGVSRSPVREALRLLERDGLVLREARRGIWVAPLSLKDCNEVYSCRIAMEGLAAEAAALSPDRMRKAKLAGVLAELRGAAARRDAPAFFRIDVEGSLLIYDLADNRTLKRLLAGLEKQALRYRFLAYARDPRIVDLSLADTALIFDAIVDGDAPAAKEMTENLIREIRDLMRTAFAHIFEEG